MCCPASGEQDAAGAAGGQGDRAAGDCRGALRYQRAGLQGAQEDDRWPSRRLLQNTHWPSSVVLPGMSTEGKRTDFSPLSEHDGLIERYKAKNLDGILEVSGSV